MQGKRLGIPEIFSLCTQRTSYTIGGVLFDWDLIPYHYSNVIYMEVTT